MSKISFLSGEFDRISIWPFTGLQLAICPETIRCMFTRTSVQFFEMFSNSSDIIIYSKPFLALITKTGINQPETHHLGNHQRRKRWVKGILGEGQLLNSPLQEM